MCLANLLLGVKNLICYKQYGLRENTEESIDNLLTIVKIKTVRINIIQKSIDLVLVSSFNLLDRIFLRVKKNYLAPAKFKSLQRRI